MMDFRYIKKGVLWVANYIIQNLDYTHLEEPTWEWTGKLALTAKLKSKELVGYNEENSKKFQKDVDTILRTLEPKYRPEVLHFKTTLGVDGNGVLDVWYELFVPQPLAQLPQTLTSQPTRPEYTSVTYAPVYAEQQPNTQFVVYGEVTAEQMGAH